MTSTHPKCVSHMSVRNVHHYRHASCRLCKAVGTAFPEDLQVKESPRGTHIPTGAGQQRPEAKGNFSCVIEMFLSPPDSYVEALTPNVMVFGRGTLRDGDLDEILRVGTP